MSQLFQSLVFNGLAFKNRIVMPPMTRCRSTQPGNVPTELMAKYYAQRAGAGLIIAEATQVSEDAQGYSYTPGIYSQEQIDGWKRVTDRVHNNGGQIFLQLWHTGRLSHAHFQKGLPPLAPSAIPAPKDARVWIANEDGQGGRQQMCTPPRAMSRKDIERVKDDFVQAAVNAQEAGFDGVELHAADGYLIDQFLRKSANQRTDKYGGTPQNRLRFLNDILVKLIDVFPANKIGVRFAPHIFTRGMDDPDTPETVLLALARMAELHIGYAHFSEADRQQEAVVPEEFRLLARKIFHGVIIVAGNYSIEKADWVLKKNYADLVAFGRQFIANPDLPYRLYNHLPLNEVRNDLLFGGDREGYTDYPIAGDPMFRRRE